jgi:hypothetical protein
VRRPFRELIFPAIAASCGLAVCVLSAGSPVRLIAAVALVLVLPGAGFGRAVLPRGERWPEHMLVALGASAAIVALAAIVLDVVGLPLKSTVWAPVLATLTVVGFGVGSLRDSPSPRRRLRLIPVRPVDALMIGASLALIAGAMVLGTTPLRAPAGTPGSTALWIEADGPRRAVAVARSGELQTARYAMSVTVDGRRVAASPSFSLAPGEERRLPVPQPLRPGARVGVLLYRLDQGAPRNPRRIVLRFGRSVPLAFAAKRR